MFTHVYQKQQTLFGRLFVVGALALTLAWSAPTAAARQSAVAQATEAADEPMGEASSAAPLIKEYKGVRIGMSADEARRALGGSDAAKDKRDVFLVSDDEMAQLFFDREGKLRSQSRTRRRATRRPRPTCSASKWPREPTGVSTSWFATPMLVTGSRTTARRAIRQSSP